jgi:hypothetical protein
VIFAISACLYAGGVLLSDDRFGTAQGVQTRKPCSTSSNVIGDVVQQCWRYQNATYVDRDIDYAYGVAINITSVERLIKHDLYSPFIVIQVLHS